MAAWAASFEFLVFSFELGAGEPAAGSVDSLAIEVNAEEAGSELGIMNFEL